MLGINAITYSAIMKYHSLKMEEVNDTMRHIWNKTYQGTGAHKRSLLTVRSEPITSEDIDGIRIRYDSEGGASKRSYNYRVSTSPPGGIETHGL
jgi:DNA repair protein RAD50